MSMLLDLEYSGEQTPHHRDMSRGVIANRSSRRRQFDDSFHHDNKENLLRPAEANIGSSKSYIMAMRTLQVKLEEKDKRIKDLENIIKEIH